MALTNITIRDQNKPLAGVSGERHVFKLGCFQGHVLDVEDALFNTGSAVLLPNNGSCDESDPAAQRTEGIKMIAVCIDQHRRFGEQKVLVVGHTDTVGDDDDNFELSLLRAQNVLAVLLGKQDDWVQGAIEKHVDDDVRAILIWAAGEFSIDCVPGKNLQKALAAFQEHQGIDTKAPDVDELTWGAFFVLYQEMLAKLLAMSLVDLGAFQGGLNFVDDDRKAVGCGESHPIVEPGKDNVDAAENRRVEVYFFDEGEEPRLDCHELDKPCDPDLCELYNRKLYQRDRIPCEIKDPPRLSSQGTQDSENGKFFTVGRLSPPFEELDEFSVEVEAKDRDLPARISVRRGDEETPLAWAEVCPDLVFRSGKLNFKLATSDGPEASPTGHLEATRIVVSGVQQGDVVVVEELETPGKAKGRTEVYVVKNFTFHDWNRCGGKLGFHGALDGLSGDVKTQIVKLIGFMLDQSASGPQAIQRDDIWTRINKKLPRDSDETGAGQLFGHGAGPTDFEFGACELRIPSARGVGMYPKDFYHVHAGVIGDGAGAPGTAYQAAVVRKKERANREQHLLAMAKITPKTGPKARLAFVEFVRSTLQGIVKVLAATVTCGSPRLHAHSYEDGGTEYLLGPQAGPKKKKLRDGDPIRNINGPLSRGTAPTLFERNANDSLQATTAPDGLWSQYGPMGQLQILVTRHHEVLLFAQDAIGDEGKDFFKSAGHPTLIQLADALGEL